MKKTIQLTLLVLLGLFLVTGCVRDEIKEQEDEDMKKETVYKVEQISNKELSLEAVNAKKGMTEVGTLTLEEGEDIIEVYSLHGLKAIEVYVIQKGKNKEEAYVTDSLSGEGKSITSELEGGEYEILIEVVDEHATGTITIKAGKEEEEKEDEQE